MVPVVKKKKAYCPLNFIKQMLAFLQYYKSETLSWEKWNIFFVGISELLVSKTYLKVDIHGGRFYFISITYIKHVKGTWLSG